MTNRRTVLVAIAATGALAAPLVAPASGDLIEYYNPPKMVKRGTNTSPIVGKGKVVVKVLVNPDGSFKVQSVISSTNHADDAAALEIARSSVYTPASRGAKKQVAFYDFTLNFAGGAASDPSAAGAGGPLATYESELHGGKYADAQTGLKAYVADHPDDAKGQLDLGVADTYLSDYAGGAAAFDKAGTVPSGYRAVATKAYVETAVGLLSAKDYTNGLVAAKRAADFQPGFVTDDTLGVAQLESGDAPTAIATLEKAHALAATDTTVPSASRTANDIHLVQAYLANGDLANAQKISSEATGLDPKSAASIASAMANYYASKAQDAGKAGKYEDAGALYTQAAEADPSQAATLYVFASFAYLKVNPNPLNDKAKASADKALTVDPNSAVANYAEGISLANMNKKSDAQASLNKADALAKAASNATLVTEIERALKQLSGDSSS